MEQLRGWGERVCSELLRSEMRIKNMPGSIRGQRSGSRDNEYSLHAPTSVAISQMKIENTLIASPGTDKNRLPSAPFQSQFLRLVKAISGLAELEITSISSTPIPPFYRQGN